ncbi:hypothetical protein ACQPYE_17510 [Actinosynnema sp. CA-299493]
MKARAAQFLTPSQGGATLRSFVHSYDNGELDREPLLLRLDVVDEAE